MQVACTPHLLKREVFDIGNIEALWLRYDTLRGGVGVQRCHLERDAKVLFGLLSNIIDVGYAGPELAQGYIFDVLRPNHRKAGDGATADRSTCDCSATFQQAPPGNFLSVWLDFGFVVFH